MLSKPNITARLGSAALLISLASCSPEPMSLSEPGCIPGNWEAARGDCGEGHINVTELVRLQEDMADVYRQFPSPEPPSREAVPVADIDANGNFLLTNGTRLAMAGVRCGDEFVARVTLDLQDLTPYHVVYQPTGNVVDGAESAYIWKLGIDGDTGMPDPQRLSLLNQGEIIEGTCTAIEQPFHDYHEIFSALAAIAQ